MRLPIAITALMADRLEVRLHGQRVGWITRASRRERIEFEWVGGYMPGPVTLTESFGSVRSKAPTASASSFFGGYALEGRQREQLTRRRGIRDPTDLYAMLREFGSSIAGAVTIADPDAMSRTELPTSRSASKRSLAVFTGPRRTAMQSGGEIGDRPRGYRRRRR